MRVIDYIAEPHGLSVSFAFSCQVSRPPAQAPGNSPGGRAVHTLCHAFLSVLCISVFDLPASYSLPLFVTFCFIQSPTSSDVYLQHAIRVSGLDNPTLIAYNMCMHDMTVAI